MNSLRQRPPGTIRIIGGKWRRRRIPVCAVPGLRPTPDRVRETLFNWLQSLIQGSHCLDLFAGSGALGFEAASRGAREVVMVERDLHVVWALEQQVARLEAQEVRVVWAEALKWLKVPAVSAFDVVFVDPPFGENLLGPCCQQLQTGRWLKPHALIYLETQCSLTYLPIPEHWYIKKEGRAGEVRYYLARNDKPEY